MSINRNSISSIKIIFADFSNMKIVNFKFPREYIKNKKSFKKLREMFPDQCDIFCKEILKIFDVTRLDHTDAIRNMIHHGNISYLKSIFEFFQNRNIKIGEAAHKLLEEETQSTNNTEIVHLKKKLNQRSQQIAFLAEKLQEKTKQVTKKDKKIEYLINTYQNQQRKHKKFSILTDILNHDYYHPQKDKLSSKILSCTTLQNSTVDLFNRKIKPEFRKYNQVKTAKLPSKANRQKQNFLGQVNENKIEDVPPVSPLGILEKISVQSKQSDDNFENEDILGDNQFSERKSKISFPQSCKKDSNTIREHFLENESEEKKSQCKQVILQDSSDSNSDNFLI